MDKASHSNPKNNKEKSMSLLVLNSMVDLLLFVCKGKSVAVQNASSASPTLHALHILKHEYLLLPFGRDLGMQEGECYNLPF